MRITLICQNKNCGKEFIVEWKYRNRKYCKKTCQIPWLKGKQGVQSEESRKKRSESLKKYYQTKEGIKKRERLTQKNLQDNNPWRKGNYDEEWKEEVYEKVRKTYKNPEIRKKCASMIGKTHSEKTKKIQSEKRKQWWNNLTDNEREKYSKKMSKIRLDNPRIMTDETRKKHRIGILKHIEETNGAVCPIMGKNEEKILDEKQRKLGVDIERNFHIKKLGYVVDGYCKETNTIYEVYEKYHTGYKQKGKDKRRKNEIQKLLNCNFEIIWDL